MKTKENKLQQKICAMFQRTFQFTLHIFSKLCVSLRKKGCEKFVDCEKSGKFDISLKNKIMPLIKELGFVLKKILNIEEFKKVDDIIQYLITNFLPDEELSVSKTICLEKNNNIQLFVMFGKKEVFVIKDDGFNIKIIYRIEKTNFKYHIIKQDGKPKLYIEDTVTSLPININYSGDTSIVQFKIDKFIKE